MQSVLRITNVGFSYHEGEEQLKKVSINASKGECIAVIGGSGCGKSTLTRVINGLIPSFYSGKLSGDVNIDGIDLKTMASWEIGAKIGNVFQDPRSQFFSSEVTGEIAFGCENLGMSHSDIQQRVHQTIHSMKIESLAKASIYTLSYGMRQKVAICSAKAMNPEIYVFDEPSANLDLQATLLLADLIQELKSEGKTIIIAEHRLFYLKGIADRYLLMENGSISKIYSAAQMQNLDSDYMNRKGLRSMNLKDISVNKEIPAISGTSLSVEIKNLCKSYGSKAILKDVSFQYDGNEIIALVGENGIGKSTLGKVMAGLTKESDGQILIDGRPVSHKKRIGKIWYIPQDLDSQLFGENLVDELTSGLKSSIEETQKAEAILTQLGLFPFKSRHPATLSGGQKQRLVLGVAMMRETPMIILDEPTSGLDFCSMEKVRKLILEQQTKGTKFLIISHDIEFIARTCNRVLKIERGHITEDYYLHDVADLLNSMGYKEGKI